MVGLCGGYQMLGRRISDPAGIEGAPGGAEGLGLLDVETVLTADKTLVEAEGRDLIGDQPVRGYEMHVGRTTGPDGERPMLSLAGRSDGAVSWDRRVMGCYLHGLFAADGFRHAFLTRVRGRSESGIAFDAEIERTLDRLADHLETHVQLDHLLAVAGTAPKLPNKWACGVSA